MIDTSEYGRIDTFVVVTIDLEVKRHGWGGVHARAGAHVVIVKVDGDVDDCQ
jgi:hypothetical protein